MNYNSDLNQNLYDVNTGNKVGHVSYGRIHNQCGPTTHTVGAGGIIRDGYYNVTGQVYNPPIIKTFPMHP
jgi:hypothetical protein